MCLWQSPSMDGSLEVETDDDSEILDELTTRRGELKLRSVSFSADKHPQASPLSLDAHFALNKHICKLMHDNFISSSL